MLRNDTAILSGQSYYTIDIKKLQPKEKETTDFPYRPWDFTPTIAVS